MLLSRSGGPDGGNVLRHDAGFVVRAHAYHHLDQEDHRGALAVRRKIGRLAQELAMFGRGLQDRSQWFR